MAKTAKTEEPRQKKAAPPLLKVRALIIDNEQGIRVSYEAEANSKEEIEEVSRRLASIINA